MQRMTARQYQETSSETKTQIALIQLLNRIKYDSRPLRYAAIPNGGKRDKRGAAILQKMGVKAGLSDILIFDSPPNYPLMKGAALEMKKRIGGVVSDEQQDWLDYFNSNSWVAGVAEGLDEALKYLEDWGYL